MRRPLLIALLGAAAFAPTAGAADGGEVFLANCAPCHGPDGKARTPMGRKLHAKDLAESKLADPAIEKQILTGTKDAKGEVRMPSFKDQLASEEIAAVIAFVKTLRH